MRQWMSSVRSSLGWRLTVWSVALSGLGLVGLAWFAYVQAAGLLVRAADENAARQVSAAARHIDETLMRAAAVAKTVVSFQEAAGGKASPLSESFYARLMDKLPREELFAVYANFEKADWRAFRENPGMNRNSQPRLNRDSYDFHDPDQLWYAVPFRENRLAISEPYFDAGSGDITMVSVTLPIRDQAGNPVGVGGVDIPIDGLQRMAERVRLPVDPERQVAFLVSAEGRIVEHPDESLLPAKDREGASVDRLPEGRHLRGARGASRIELDGKRYRLYWDTAPFARWTVALRVPEELILAPVHRLRAQMLGGAAVALALLAFAVGTMARKALGALAPLDAAAKAMAEGDLGANIDAQGEDEVGRLAETMRRLAAAERSMADLATAVAAGDLTRTLEPRGPKDALGVALRDMTDSLRGLIGDLQRAAGELDERSRLLAGSVAASQAGGEEAARSVDDVCRASEEAARSTQQIAQGSEALARGATEAAEAMTRLLESIEAVGSASADQREAAQRARSTADRGAETLGEALDSIRSIERRVTESAKAVQELGERQEQIGAILGTIAEIAGQTNLLALNAAIEAARAGEAGRGFAVVAEEVRKLAERAASATTEIGELLGAVRGSVDTAVATMRASVEEVRAGAAHSEDAQRSLSEIVEAVRRMQASAEAGAGVAERMRADSSVVAETLTQVAAVSQETAAGAEQMSASVQETSAAMAAVAAVLRAQAAEFERVVQASDDLARLADRLAEQAARFRLGDRGSEPGLRAA
ncbi:MAG: methyl-accepting chemotaxis protein [Fimbriimonadales bacterium]|nr:methyl-accepting chemotaxis protein [Fimbriimonadales bacterium]